MRTQTELDHVFEYKDDYVHLRWMIVTGVTIGALIAYGLILLAILIFSK